MGSERPGQFGRVFDYSAHKRVLAVPAGWPRAGEKAGAQATEGGSQPAERPGREVDPERTANRGAENDSVVAGTGLNVQIAGAPSGICAAPASAVTCPNGSAVACHRTVIRLPLERNVTEPEHIRREASPAPWHPVAASRAASPTPTALARDLLAIQSGWGNAATTRLIEQASLQRQKGATAKRKPPAEKIRPQDDSDKADKEGLRLGRLIAKKKLEPASGAVEKWIKFFEGRAQTRFLHALNEGIGQGEIEFYGGKERAHPDYDAVLMKEKVVMPRSGPRVDRGGFTISLFATITKQDIQSTYVEVYTRTSGEAGIGIEIPLKKIIKLRAGVKVEAGKTRATRDEQRDVRVEGKTISRNFTAQKVSREVMNVMFEKTSFGISLPYPEGDMRLPAGRLPSRVEREYEGMNPAERQVGYRLVPQEGGEPSEAVWNGFSDNGQVPGSALKEIWKAVEEEQNILAKDLALSAD